MHCGMNLLLHFVCTAVTFCLLEMSRKHLTKLLSLVVVKQTQLCLDKVLIFVKIDWAICRPPSCKLYTATA